MSSSNNLSSWKRFKQWMSHHFGCTSSYHLKEGGHVTRPPIKRVKNKKTRQLESGKPTVTTFPNKTLSALPPEPTSIQRSFSKDSEDIPFIDASLMNLPKTVSG